MSEQEIKTFEMLQSWSDPKRPRPVNFMSQDYLEKLSMLVATVKNQAERIERLERELLVAASGEAAPLLPQADEDDSPRRRKHT